MTYLMVKMAQYKTVLLIAAMAIMAIISVPAAHANTGTSTNPTNDPLGITRFDNSGTRLGTRNLETTVAGIINVGLSLLGVVAVVIIIIGGAKVMFSGGNEEARAGGIKFITTGVIGLAIIFSAWAIAKFVLVKLAQETGVQGSTNYQL